MITNGVVSAVFYLAAIIQRKGMQGRSKRYRLNNKPGDQFDDPVGEWLSFDPFNLAIAGSNPVRITS